jgi:hypothetical protein
VTALGLGPGLYGNLPFADYLADPCTSPSLNSSLAKTLLDRSPLHAFHEHPRLGGGGGERPTRAMDTGTVIHALVLGGGQEYVAVDADDWRTKRAQERRDEIRAAGQIPILARQLEACAEVARRLDDVIPADTQREVTAVWLSEGAVLCRGRIDALAAGEAMVLDLKTCEDAARAAEGRSVVSFGRDMEAASRLDSLETLLPALAGRLTFRYVFAEIEAPYAVVEAELAGDLLERGRRRWRLAVEQWAVCMESNSWPGPYRGRVRIEAPPWAMEAALESEIRLGLGQRNSNAEFGGL